MRSEQIVSLAARPHWHLSGWAQRILAFLAGLAGLIIITRALWLAPLGAFLIVSDPMIHADAIVPLAGERARVTYAGSLLKQGEADRFVITDMWIPGRSQTYNYASMIQVQATHEGIAAQQIVMAPGVAGSTYQEALNLREFAQHQKWHSLLVVTSPYHTRRARMILREVFSDSHITVAVVPIAPHWYEPDTWWRSWSGWQTTASEYFKLALYLIGYHHWFA